MISLNVAGGSRSDAEVGGASTPSWREAQMTTALDAIGHVFLRCM
jgi:transcription elongation factor